MIEIGMSQVFKNFGFKNVLSGVSLEIQTADRAAIVGRNGTGKSTILRIIAGIEVADKGSVSIRKGASVGYLQQIPDVQPAHVTVFDVLMAAFDELNGQERRLRELEAEMSAELDAVKLQDLMRRYDYAQRAFSAKGGYEIEEHFFRAVTGFGLSELLDRPFNVLSGGQKTIVRLAATLLRQPDILLLDEPTNHLDIRALEWFEDFLSHYAGTVVIVSHDRHFLDKVATRTIFLNRGECTAYEGNYSFSIKERERQLLVEFEHYKTQQKQIAAMRAAIKRYREWAARSDNEDLYRKAKELEKRIERMEILENPERDKRKLTVRFSGKRTGKEVLRAEHFSLALGETKLFRDANLLILEREKVCLLGDNGTGKTSLVRAILGDIPYGGKLVISPSAQIGYIPQEIHFEDESDTVVKAFQREYVSTEGEARNILAKYFFFGDSVFKRVSALSGGEKVLLKLASLLLKSVNFLVLDEPTNHIDIDTREILENALLEYEGTLLFISHDRFFIDKVASRRVTIEGQAFRGR